MRDRNPNGEYSTESTRHPGYMTGGSRVLVASGGAGGTGGTDRAYGRAARAVLMSSSTTERRRGRCGGHERAARPPRRAPGRQAPLPPRHALSHLTTLRPRRLYGAWFATSAVGKTRSSAPTSVGRKRRITRTRLGATAETRVIRAKGFRSLPVWQGELVYGDFAHRDISRAACAAEVIGARVVVHAHRFVDHWVFGGTSQRRRLPNRCGLVRTNGSLTGAAGASRVQVIFRRRLLS
jgi:hypothetical protein